MKYFLGISFILNLVMGYHLFFGTPEKVVVERLIIESHDDKKTKAAEPEKAGMVKETSPSAKEARKKEAPLINVHDPQDFQEAGETMETERLDFLTENLGMSEEKILKHNQIRDDFYQRTSLFWKKNPMRELSFEERRQILDMEEEFFAKLEKLHGKKNWLKYQKYRENYNNKGYKKQMEEGQPFIFMGI